MELIPYHSLEGVQLGASRDSIRTALGDDYKEYRDLLGNMRDTYSSLGLRIFYDDQGKCSAIEASDPAKPSIQGLCLLGKRSTEIQSWLAGLDAALKVDADGITSLKLGISLHVPDVEGGSSNVIESVFLFRAGYYDYDEEKLKNDWLKACGLAEISEYTFLERMKIRIRRILGC